MSSQSWVGKTIGGRYQIEALLGQGGMSAVYRALDPNLRRTVAIKLIHPHLSADPNFIGRFKEEAAAVARLRHPNIVQVHDFDLDGETYYMVMEYLIGETLQSRLKRLNSTGRHLSFTDASRICIQICDAAGYAHDHELIHRDIKPANIMLDVNGQAILMDFGIVKIIGGEYHTSTGATIGTAMYMSPEQIRGERINDCSDIYSLGVTLYEMISGRPPYQADSAVTLMMMVLNDPLPSLRDFREGIPDELLAVVNWALAKDKSIRYQSMAGMAEDLKQIQGNLDGALPAATVANNNKVEELELPVPSASATQPDNNILPEIPNREALPEAELGNISADQTYKKREEIVSTVLLDQDTREKPESTPIGSPKPKIYKVINWNSRRFILPIVGILLLAIIVSGYLYITGKQLPKVELASLTSSTTPIEAGNAKNVVSLGKWGTDSYGVDLAFSPDGTILATANNRDWLRLSQYRFYAGLWQIDPGSLIRYITGPTRWVADVAFSPDGKLIATASEDANIFLWQVQDGEMQRKIETTYGSFSSVDFSSNNLLLSAGSLDGYTALWQIDNGNLLRTMEKQDYSILDVKFSLDGSYLAAASGDNSILIWKVSDGRLQLTLKGHTAAVTKVAFSPDGTILASASEDHTIRLWRIKDSKLLNILEGHTETVKGIAFSSDGSLLASGSDDGTIRFWRVVNGSLLNTIVEEEPILSVLFSPDSTYLVSSGSYGTLHFWGISEAIPLDVLITPVMP